MSTPALVPFAIRASHDTRYFRASVLEPDGRTVVQYSISVSLNAAHSAFAENYNTGHWIARAQSRTRTMGPHHFSVRRISALTTTQGPHEWIFARVEGGMRDIAYSLRYTPGVRYYPPGRGIFTIQRTVNARSTRAQWYPAAAFDWPIGQPIVLASISIDLLEPNNAVVLEDVGLIISETLECLGIFQPLT
ncbi:hypothetical protein B0H17DRAFT_1208498 [Mycena rosella]|uniref:Uncharacterized protein n=1 Tax=Mycena rosella TaxID=1033263 RepID=A0AAD7G9H9_MYCRO|nr:hypothetical protein B0H17DRAFT_1208498 [Mycena rosella]